MEHEAIKTAINRFRADRALPGVSAAWVTPGGGMVTYATGFADMESAEPLASRHRMPTGSIGKTFTAAAALRLAMRGRLDLDESVSRWLGGEPWFPGLPHGARVTLRMLLSHTSGVADHRTAPRFAAALQNELRRNPPNHELYFSPSELIGFVADVASDFEPGRCFRYSETGYILAGLVVERAARQEFYAHVREHFVDRFHLDSTEPANKRDIAGVAQGYVEPNDLGIPEHALEARRLALDPSTEWAGGGFVSTASDLCRWVELLFDGRAMNHAYLDEMLGHRVASGNPDFDYGLGCYKWKTAYGSAFGHSGEVSGYRSIMAWFPDCRTAVALQTNTSRTEHAILRDLLACFAGAAFAVE